jgi:hypothetical protein
MEQEVIVAAWGKIIWIIIQSLKWKFRLSYPSETVTRTINHLTQRNAAFHVFQLQKQVWAHVPSSPIS